MELKILNETKNELFPRTEVKAEVAEEVVPTKEAVLEVLAAKYKVDKEAIKVIDVKGQFGLKVFEVNAHIYTSPEEKDRIEVKTKQEKEAEKKAKEEADKAAAEAKATEDAAKAEEEAKKAEEAKAAEAPAEEKKEEAPKAEEAEPTATTPSETTPEDEPKETTPTEEAKEEAKA